MIARDWSHIDALFESSGGYLVNPNGLGLLDLLSQFAAYADPLYKKTNYFLALMKNGGLWTYHDPENLGPPVNYHESRLQVRLGGVEVLDAELLLKLMRGDEVSEEEDFVLRKAVKEAIEYVARGLGKTPSEIHYFNWNYARNCCTRHDPHCNSCGDSCKLPDRYKIGEHGGKRCVLSSVCASKDSPEKPLDPYSNTIWH